MPEEHATDLPHVAGEAGRAAPGDDAKQAIRMRRYGMAAGTALLVVLLLYICDRLGVFAGAAFYTSAAMILFWVVAFFIAFRSGWNLRARDPSLTLPMMTAATLTMLWVAYAADEARSVFLLIIVMIFVFGILRLSTAVMLRYAAFILLGVLAVIGLLWRFRPQALDLRLELLQWAVLALTLPWFALMGGYISALRERLQQQNANLKAALKRAEASEASLAEAQRIANLGSWSYDPASGEAQWSAETFRIFGVDPTRAAPVREDFYALIHPNDRDHQGNLIREALQTGREFDCQFRIVPIEGTVRWVHAQGRPVLEPDGRTRLLRGTVLDITERMAAEERIRELAHFDSLSGLPNRNLFTQLLNYALAKAARERRPVALLFIDLDGFKQVNDTLGHDAGDRVLATFGRRLRQSLRKSDATARLTAPGTPARLGGDEFAVLIDDFDEPSALHVVARKVLGAATEPVELGQQEVGVSASIGIALYPQDGSDAAALLSAADRAMYRAKQAGKNAYRFASEMVEGMA